MDKLVRCLEERMAFEAKHARFAGLGRSMGRLAVVGGLAACMAAGQVAPAVALAEGTGTITIKDVVSRGSEGTLAYQGYQIFTANVSEKSEVSDLAWANDDVKAAVEGVIKSEDKSYAGTTAQDAALWMRSHFSTGNTDVVAAQSAAAKVAKAVQGKASTVRLKENESQALSQGYWLFVSDSTTTDGKAGVAGTAPIFTLVGTQASTVYAKTSVPSGQKTVATESGRNTTSVDAKVGDVLDYRLRGTLPTNLDAYEKYYYQFEDTLSKGLTYQGDVKVNVLRFDGDAKKWVPTDVTSKFSVVTKDNADGTTTMTVTCDDVKALQEVKGDGLSRLEVTYKAKVNANAVVGSEGNENKLTLHFSNDPNSDSKGTVRVPGTDTYTFQLDVAKVDKATRKSLPGAKFTIQEYTADGQPTGKYLQADGSLGDEPHEFETNEKGLLSVARIDSGNYLLHETQAPKSDSGTYDKIEDVKLQIRAAYIMPNSLNAGQDGTSSYSLSAKVDGKDAEGGIDANGDGKIDQTDANEKIVDAKAGIVRVTVGDGLTTTLPITGGQGIALAAGTGLIVIAISAIAMNHRRDMDVEE